MAKVRISITKTGGVLVEGVGFVGDSCKKATAGIEQALGQVISSTPKPEMYLGEQETRVDQELRA